MRSKNYLILTLTLFAWHTPPERAPQEQPTREQTPPERTPRPHKPAQDRDHIVDSVRVLCLYGSIPAKG